MFKTIIRSEGLLSMMIEFEIKTFCTFKCYWVLAYDDNWYCKNFPELIQINSS